MVSMKLTGFQVRVRNDGFRFPVFAVKGGRRRFPFSAVKIYFKDLACGIKLGVGCWLKVESVKNDGFGFPVSGFCVQGRKGSASDPVLDR